MSTDLKQELKTLIIEECDKEDDITLDEFSDDMPILGNKSPLDLDSLDTLQISMAIQKTYGVRIEGAGTVRKAMKSINTLAEFIQKNSN